jgi:hypothetical protein
MPFSFWETMGAFESERAALARLQGRVCGQMDTIRCDTMRVIASSRELLHRIDDIMARDPWHARDPVARTPGRAHWSDD